MKDKLAAATEAANDAAAKVKREPFMYGGVGAVVGLLILYMDRYHTPYPSRPMLQHAFAFLLVLLFTVGVGVGAAYLKQTLENMQRESYLIPMDKGGGRGGGGGGGSYHDGSGDVDMDMDDPAARAMSQGKKGGGGKRRVFRKVAKKPPSVVKAQAAKAAAAAKAKDAKAD